jgi:hypothetical protein
MYLALARQRLRWYLRTTGNLVLQHWQVVALACLIVPGPPVIAIFLQLASFLQSPVSPALDVAQRFALVLAIDGAAVLWLAPQRHALSGGPFAHYLATLPLPKGVMLAVEGTLLTVANSVILIAAIIAAVRMAAAGASGYTFCCFAILLGGAAIAQRAVLDRRFPALFGIVACDVALAVGMSSDAMAMRALGLFGAVAFAGAGLAAAYAFERPTKCKQRDLGGRMASMAIGAVSRYAPSLLIQCKALCARPTQAGLRLSAAVALAFGANRLIEIFKFDSRSLPTAILAMSVAGLLLSGIYRTLFDAHRAMATYLATLPVSRRYWSVRDTGFLLLLNSVVLIILLAPQIVEGLASLALLFTLAAAAQALMAVLRWPAVYGGASRLMYSVLLAAIWSGAAIATVSR